MQRFFADAILPPPPPVVLGRQLLPYSLGHCFTLAACRSPFLYDQPGSPKRVVEAVHICSSVWPIAMMGKDAKASIDALVKSAARKTTIKRWCAEVDLLLGHIRSGHATPERWQEGEDVKNQARVPWPLKLAASMMTNGFATRADVWNMPVAEAFAWNAARRENEGDYSVMSDQELSVIFTP